MPAWLEKLIRPKEPSDPTRAILGRPPHVARQKRLGGDIPVEKPYSELKAQIAHKGIRVAWRDCEKFRPAALFQEYPPALGAIGHTDDVPRMTAKINNRTKIERSVNDMNGDDALFPQPINGDQSEYSYFKCFRSRIVFPHKSPH